MLNRLPCHLTNNRLCKLRRLLTDSH
jgi:hypothetical protein